MLHPWLRGILVVFGSLLSASWLWTFGFEFAKTRAGWSIQDKQ